MRTSKSKIKEYAERYGATEDAVSLACMLPNYDPFLQAGDCYLDFEKIEHAFQFFENEIKIIDGANPGSAFPFAPWQYSIIFNLYGWYRPDGSRRYRKCFIYIPKKNGKSTFTAAIVNYELKHGIEKYGEIYSAAAAQKQTNNVFKHVKGMILANASLGDTLQIYGGNAGVVKKIVNEDTGTKYECLAADAGTVDGLHPTLNIIDELHRHKNAELSEVLEKSTKGRVNPLTIYTTTADYDRPSECNNMLQFARSVCANNGSKDKPGYAPSFLPVVYEIVPEDYKDDSLYWTRPEVWEAVNPNFNVTVTTADFEEMVQEALEMPSRLNNFLRLHLNVRVGQAESWLDMSAYDRCDDRLPLEEWKGAKCYGALDLSSTNDITAYSLSFKRNNGAIDHYGWYFIPEDRAKQYEKKLSLPFSQWERDGYIEFTDGNYIDDEYVFNRIMDVNADFDVSEIEVDPWNAASTINRLKEAGENPVEMRAGYYTMNWPTKKTKMLIDSGKFHHGNNPVLRWMMSNVVVTTDENENVKPNKKKSEQKIDGAVSAIMSIAPHFPIEEKKEEEKPWIQVI